MSSITGELFRISTWGESHGGGVGVVVVGCASQITLSEEIIQQDLDRRRPGQSKILTPRAEADRCEILSGVFEGKTLGSPISIMVRNKDPHEANGLAGVHAQMGADGDGDGVVMRRRAYFVQKSPV